MKKTLKIATKSDNVQSSEAASEPTEASMENQPEAEDGRLLTQDEDTGEDRQDEPAAEAAPEPQTVEVKAGEPRGKGGAFISTGTGRVIRVQ